MSAITQNIESLTYDSTASNIFPSEGTPDKTSLGVGIISVCKS